MRNCFVPNCDAQCKNMPKRMMFLPPKNEEIFKIWKKVLPKKRVFKKQDRVCERHFNKEDISTTWDHIINGVLHQLERGKPKLSPTAVPILNLPTEWNQPPTDDDEELNVEKSIDHSQVKIKKMRTIDATSEKLKITKRAQRESNCELIEPQLTEAILHIKPMVEDISTPKKKRKTNEIVNEEKQQQITKPNKSIKPISDNDEDDTENVEEAEEETISNEKTTDLSNKDMATISTIFESIYEDAFEVELPSTLWAMHRDPERKFIAFSMFDSDAMRSSRVLYISNRLEAKCFIYNEVFNRSKHLHLSIDIINDILNEMDQFRICPNYTPDKQFPASCDVLLTDDAVVCSRCEQSEEYLCDDNL